MNMRNIGFFLFSMFVIFLNTAAFADAPGTAQDQIINSAVVQNLGCVALDNGKVVHKGCTLLSALDLTTPFHTPKKWIFAVIQGPKVMGGWMVGQPAPGFLSICFIENEKRDCQYSDETSVGTAMIFDQNLGGLPQIAYLESKNRDPILVETGLDSPGVGEQPVNYLIWTYNPIKDKFTLIWNRDLDALEAVKFVSDGPLAGDMIVSVDNPTHRWPWPWGIDVYRFVPPGRFIKILSFVGKAAQAGNTPPPNAVIDIDMPGILRRLRTSQ